MKSFWNGLKEIFVSILHAFGWAWWVEIVTQNPRCTYYFGPFISVNEANAAKSGYVEDLEQEGAQGIILAVKRCKPNNLTISDEWGEMERRSQPAFFSGQA